MSITAKWYGNAQLGQYSSTATRHVDWVGDTIKVALTTSLYVPNQDTNVFWSDVTNEITGTGYTAGGVALATKSVSYDSATNETRLLAADTQWTSATFTARIAVIYKDTTVATTSPLLGWVDFGADESIAAGTFTIQWDVTGVLKVATA